MKNLIISLILLCSYVAAAPAATTSDLAVDAPDRYVVVPGDTLWAISKRFLNDPWKWNELWKGNQEQIKNPNRIFPGDVLVLDRAAEEMRLRLLRAETVRIIPATLSQDRPIEAIPIVPTRDIEPFLSKPLVIGLNQLNDAPRIVRTQESRVAVGAGDMAYATGVTKNQGIYWQVFRPGSPLVDPASNETLGYVAIYLGDAKVTKMADISTVEIVNAVQEIYAGDYLQASPREIPFDGYAPHAPAKKVDGQIIALYDQLYETGPNAIVTLNKGTRDGVEVGTVFAIYRNLNAPTFTLRESPLWGRTGFIYNESNPRTGYQNEPLSDRNSPIYGRIGPAGAQFKNDKTNVPVVKLPDERYGLLMVFRVFDRASFALVMGASRPVNVLDIVTNP
jgi:LysM domain